MGHGDARHALQSITQKRRHFIHAALAKFAINQTDVYAGINFSVSVASIDSGQGVTHLRKFSNDLFYLLRFGLSGL